MKPETLVLGCYARRTGKRWYGVCLDLNLAAEADTFEELRAKINGMIVSYIDTVLDTDNRESIPELLCRRAPLRDWLIYYAIKTGNTIRRLPGNFIFKETVPFHLAYGC